RLHHMDRARRTKTIRQLAGTLARSTGPFNTVTIDAVISYPSSRRADPHNVMGTVIKAAIDGLVDAGTIPDDNAKHLTKTSIELGPPTRQPGTYRVTLNIQENP
ncbi:TPA: hypothetical protein OQU49_004438, partial [Shigella flexneri]|nr:hypothetical protein [Shigella flexneri]